MHDETKEQLAVFDSLLDGLADAACDQGMSSSLFFAKTIQVVEAIVSPQWNAIVAQGPNDSVLFVQGSPDAQHALNMACSKRPADQTPSSWIVQWTDPKVVVSEIAVGDTVWGWLVVGVVELQSTSIQREVTAGVAEILSEFVRSQQRADHAQGQQFSDQLYRFSLNSHQSLDQNEVAHNLVNDIRVLLGCERVSLFGINRNRPKLLSVSSVATIENRSTLIKKMESLVARSVKTDEPVFSDQPIQDSRQAELLEMYQEVNELDFVFGIPIARRVESGKKRETIGFLLAESTADVNRFNFARGISRVVPHVELALANVATYRSIPFRRTLSAVGRTFNFASISRLAVVAGILGLAVLAAILIKTDFKVRIRGELRPVIERNVFAPRDGIVESVFVNHGDVVKENDPLVQVRSPDLDLEIEKSDSDVLKLRQLKDSKQIALNQISSSDPDPNLAAQLASDISDIDFQIASLVDKAKFLRQQRDKLQVVCPIDGEITTWQLKQKLTDKPVRWGDPIANVAFLEGDWNVVFRVPERRIGYILDERRSRKQENASEPQPQYLEMFLESNPGESFRVPISEIGDSVTLDPEIGPVTLLKCDVPPELVNRRQGASVAADVVCGKKSYWFVWTREMVDALRRRFVW